MRIDHLAFLLALVIGANLVLLGSLVLPRIAARRTGMLLPNGAGAGGPNGTAPGEAPAGGQHLSDPYEGSVPTPFYERVVRVVSYSFIGSALLVVTITGLAEQPMTYVVLALGAFLIVLGQDIVPLSVLGRVRYPIEAVSAIVFVSLLIVLTGGYQSPFFFGYLLLLAGASLWAAGVVPFVLALVASSLYLVAVALAPAAVPIGQAELGVIGFNLIALALVSYVAAVIGREQRRFRESALRMSRFDTLTNLHTRGYFDAAIEREIIRAQRASQPFSLLMLDIDGLKAANDRYGHEAGDRLLRTVAEAVQNGIRASDFAARYGGDEFVVVLPDTDQMGALRVGEKLRFDIARLALRLDGELLQTSVSIGLVSFPDDGRSSSELMRRVDLAMYESKRRGRNQLVRFARHEHQTPGGRPAQSAAAAGPTGREGSARPATEIPISGPPAGVRAGEQPRAPWESPSR